MSEQTKSRLDAERIVLKLRQREHVHAWGKSGTPYPTELRFSDFPFVDAITSALEERDKEIERLRSNLFDKYPDARALESFHAMRKERDALQSRLNEAVRLLERAQNMMSVWDGDDIRSFIEREKGKQ